MDQNQRALSGAYMGISLGSRVFSVAYLREVMISSRKAAPRLLLLVADKPHAFTYMALKNMDANAAAMRASQVGDQKCRSIERALRALPIDRASVQIGRWDDLPRMGDFDKVRSSLHSLHSANPAFVDDVRDVFLAHCRQEKFCTVSPEAIWFGTEYVLEELAAMIFLQEYTPYTTQIAPQPPLEPLRKLYAGQYGVLPGLLSPRARLNYKVVPSIDRSLAA